MMIVYIVQHAHELGADGADIKMIGAYSSKELAERAVARMRSQPGFMNAPDGFSIDPYKLDEDHWTEGYVTV